MATFEDFLKIDIRIGTVLSAELNEKAVKPAYILTINFGVAGIKQSSAQITENYSPEQLLGRQIAAVVNFPPKQIADVISEVLILGVMVGSSGVVLLSPESHVPDGTVVA